MSTITLDKNNIQESINISKEIDFKFYFVSEDDKLFLFETLTLILLILKKKFISTNLQYILYELITNANRAIVKRIYFEKKGLNISDPQNYIQGMENFANDYLEKENEYVGDLPIKDLFVEVVFQVKNEYLSILVKNKGLPTTEEMKRIQHRIDASLNIRNTGEAFEKVGDSTEGAGLGTVMSILLLRKITNNPDGIKPYTFSINKNTNETITQLNISLNTLPEKLSEKLSEKISKEISSIPLYPENIMKLEKMMTQAELPLSKMAGVIEKDPALTIELLKVINSAQYFLPQKVKNIQNAVSLIGLSGLKNLLLSLGAKKIFESKYGRQEQLWEHAYRCAFYAFTISKDYNKKFLTDDVYIGGILHDIGEIIIRSIDKKLTADISDFCLQRGISGDIIEQLVLGCSHAKIGGQILKKWDFPDIIVTIVEFSNNPQLAPDECLEPVEIVYLADQLAMLQEKRIKLTGLKLDIFKKYNLNSSKEIYSYMEQLHQKHTAQYEK